MRIGNAHKIRHAIFGQFLSLPLSRCHTSLVPQKYMYVTHIGSPFLVGLVGRGGALIETMTFNRRVVGSTPALAATWASPLPAVACALRRETPIQYPCCSLERL